jgi:hypothetical protein
VDKCLWGQVLACHGGGLACALHPLHTHTHPPPTPRSYDGTRYLLDARTNKVYTNVTGSDWPKLVGTWDGRQVQLMQQSASGGGVGLSWSGLGVGCAARTMWVAR